MCSMRRGSSRELGFALGSSTRIVQPDALRKAGGLEQGSIGRAEVGPSGMATPGLLSQDSLWAGATHPQPARPC